jgi:hypothetical protein
MPVSAWSWVSSIRSSSVSNRRKLGEESSCFPRELRVGSLAAPEPDRPSSSSEEM